MVARASVFLIAIVASALVFQPFARAAEIVIAARDDARPFIWKDPSTGNYLGFFWDICSTAVQRAGYIPRPQPVNAAQRKDFLDSNRADYDLLCDPTTITIDRMRTFAEKAPHLVFSPIIFVANGTYVSPRPSESNTGIGKIPADIKAGPDACKELLARQKAGAEKGAAEGAKEDDGAWITFFPKQRSGSRPNVKENFEVWGYLRGSTIGEKLEQAEALKSLGRGSNILICLNPMESHAKAAEEFCSDRLARYFGDAEIVKSAIQTHNEVRGEGCKFTLAPSGTYEPYALITSSRKVADFPQKFALALYTMFADETVERLFAAHFPGAKKSEYLSTLFRINRVPKGVTPPEATPAVHAGEPDITRN